MSALLSAVCIIFGFIILLLVIKIMAMKNSAQEICAEFSSRIHTETNTLIDISSGDRSMRKLADTLNDQLRLLRTERLRYQNGDLELKRAVSNISHDLRTPLTAISGYLELLEQEENSEKAVRYVKRIRNRTEFMKNLTDELFRYLTAVSAKEELCIEKINLNQAVEESIAAFYAVLKEKGITPKISIPSIKAECYADRNALSRILENILSNALKYSDGDLSIVIGESGEIVFANTAASLSSVTVGRLFDRFFTVETGRSSSGLGLSIAKHLTEQMGGKIRAEYRNQTLYITLSFPVYPICKEE